MHRRPLLLLIGCGDVGLRVVKALGTHWRVVALTSSAARLPDLRAAGVTPLQGNLDHPVSLRRFAALAGQADGVLHLAPPAPHGMHDQRTTHLIQALARAMPVGRPLTMVYGSTTGVYGDAAGARFNETRSLAPATDRARRRVDAETQVRRAGRTLGWRVSLLRIPGIYALDREGGDPRDRLRRGTPLLVPADDVYTNHIHANDLARACIAALTRGGPQRAYHVCDDATLPMGDHFDRVADLCGQPRLQRITRAEATQQLSPMQMSFLSESRQLDNARLKRELRMTLRYPTVDAAFTPPTQA